MSSISGEERESETAGECYLVVVKGCPGLTARHAAAPLHSTTYSTYSTLSNSVSRPVQLLRAYCEILGVRIRHRWKRDASSVCLLWLSNSRLGFDSPPNPYAVKGLHQGFLPANHNLCKVGIFIRQPGHSPHDFPGIYILIFVFRWLHSQCVL